MQRRLAYWLNAANAGRRPKAALHAAVKTALATAPGRTDTTAQARAAMPRLAGIAQRSSMTCLRRTVRARGFSLVEVMVTLFIIAIGALGVAGLQLAAMRSNHSAYLRSHVTLAAYALSDRMRAHPAEFDGIKIDTDSPDGHAIFTDWARELNRTPLEKPAAAALATLDCTGDVCSSGHCGITIRWNDSRGEPPALSHDHASGADGAAARNIEALEFRICARLPT